VLVHCSKLLLILLQDSGRCVVFSGYYYYWQQSSTDKPHPRFLVQDHILRVGGGVDALYSTNPYDEK
jgi:hypothetical protein